MDGKSTSVRTLVNVYESLDDKANHKSKFERENYRYQDSLKLLTDSGSSIQQEGERSVEEKPVNIFGSQELPLEKNLTSGTFPTSNLQESLSAKSRPKKVGSPPQIPERADLMENVFQEFETGFNFGKRTLKTPKKNSTSVTKKPVPTPRSFRVNSCPSIGTEHGSTVNKALLDDQDRTPLALQQRTDNVSNRETKFLDETGDDTENLTKGDPCLDEKNRCVNLKYSDKKQMSKVGDDRKLFDIGRQRSELRPLPDGSDIPDSDEIAELISFADLENLETSSVKDGEVESNEDGDTLPPLPPKDILSRNYTRFETSVPTPLLSPSSSKDFFRLSHPASYPDQILETRQNCPHTQGKMKVQSSSELPVSHIQGMQNFNSSFDIVHRSTPMPISSMAQTPYQFRVTCEGLSELSRPLPPVPTSSMPETSANILLEQFNSSSVPNYASSAPSLTTPHTVLSETNEQPIYDFPLPPVPLPPTIPVDVLHQPAPDYLPFSKNSPNVEIKTCKIKKNDVGSSTDENANAVSASCSEPEVLPFEELKRKYGKYATAVAEIHREYPYEYDTCHAWLVAYDGDKQKVLRFFKINILVSFTCRSEGDCKRALDLYKMDLQRAANHLLNSE